MTRRARSGRALAVAALVGAALAICGRAPATGAGTTTSAAALAPPDGARPIVVRGATWFVRNSLSGGPATSTFDFGAPGDTPVVGDWDGNGSDTPGVVRGSVWMLRNSNSGGPADVTFNYGRPTDIPVVGDWDGNGTYTPGIVRGSSWFLRNTNSGGPPT